VIIDYAAQVDIGKKEANDDRALVDGIIVDSNYIEGTVDVPAVVAVCDGCGGYQGGNIAAELVLDTLRKESPPLLTDTSYLSHVLSQCQQLVLEKKREMPTYSDMCTTVAGCIFTESSIIVFHSGDSRVYRCDEWGIAKMTRDHSIVQDMIDMGEILPEDALHHPKRNVISRCIGIDGPSPEIYVSNTPIYPGEKYVLCSDGLWEAVDEKLIKEALDKSCSLKETADNLVQLALKNGSEDNISIIICSREGSLAHDDSEPYILD